MGADERKIHKHLRTLLVLEFGRNEIYEPICGGQSCGFGTSAGDQQYVNGISREAAK